MHRQKRQRPCSQGGDQHRDDAGQVSAEQIDDGIADIGIDVSSGRDRLDDRREIIIGQDHRSGILADFRSGDAHCDADIGLLQRRRIIDTVSGHRDQFALTLPSIDDADLMLWCDTRIDTHFFQMCIQFFIAHRIELHAIQALIAVMIDADRTGDAAGSHFMVAGDHDRDHAGTLTVGDRLCAFLTRRGHERRDAHEGHLIFILQRQRTLVHDAVGQAKHAQAVFRKAFVAGKHRAAVFIGDGACALLALDLFTAAQQLIAGTFDKHDQMAVDLMQRRHHLTL